MILVTMGTQKQPFTRLLDYVEKIETEEEIIVQAGHTPYQSKKMKIFDFVPYEQMQKYIQKADLIITHAGTGSILFGLKQGKKVIACARLKKFGEHVDNHQKQIVEIFKEGGYLLEVSEEEPISEVMEKAKTFVPKHYESNTENFIRKLVEEIDKPKKA